MVPVLSSRWQEAKMAEETEPRRVYVAEGHHRGPPRNRYRNSSQGQKISASAWIAGALASTAIPVLSSPRTPHMAVPHGGQPTSPMGKKRGSDAMDTRRRPASTRRRESDRGLSSAI